MTQDGGKTEQVQGNHEGRRGSTTKFGGMWIISLEPEKIRENDAKGGGSLYTYPKPGDHNGNPGVTGWIYFPIAHKGKANGRVCPSRPVELEHYAENIACLETS
jgi:hypothetical protein